MAKILLIQPPLTEKELFRRGSKASASIIPPLGLGYLASYLIKHGHECNIIDGVAEYRTPEEICRISDEFDVVGITVVSTYAVRVVELLKVLKKSGVAKPLVVGGPHVTALPESLLEYGADFAVVGEGEITMLELVEELAAGRKNFREIAGLVYRDGSEVVKTAKRSHIENLDSVPPPARHLMPMHLYHTSSARATRQPSHSILVSRGCGGVCTFCSKRTFGTKLRYFSPERITEEFFILRDQYGAQDISVWDDNFLSNQELINQACEILQHKGFDKSWSIESRIDNVNRSILKTIKASGCNYIAYGIESGSQRILDYVHKGITLEQIEETVRMTQEVGIKIRGYFMIGLPTETREEIESTIRFALKLNLDMISCTLFIPLPGTTEYRRAQNTGSFPDPEYYFKKVIPEINFLDEPLYVPEGMDSRELLEIHRSFYNRYYMRPKFLLRRLASMRSTGELYSNLSAGVTLVVNALRKFD